MEGCAKTVTEELRGLLAESFKHVPEIANISQFGDLRDHGIGSLDLVGLMILIETQFGVRIPDKCVTPENFRSLQSIAALIVALQEVRNQ
jgi:acyl carrier protein